MCVCKNVGRICSCLLHNTGYSNFIEQSYSVGANNSTADRKTPRLGTHLFNHPVKPRSLMDPVLSWMMPVGTLFNIL